MDQSTDKGPKRRLSVEQKKNGPEKRSIVRCFDSPLRILAEKKEYVSAGDPPPTLAGVLGLAKVRNGSDRKGAGRVAFPPPKVGVTRTLPYPIRPHSGDCSVAVTKTGPDA
ncbi:unnamed protein product [Boreogadus saida]